MSQHYPSFKYSPQPDRINADTGNLDTMTGWACFGKGKFLVQSQFSLTQFGDDSVDLDIICCGICGTDIHYIDSDWGSSNYPFVGGHEIIGLVTRIGKNVKHLKVGDRAGVGYLCSSCHSCSNCQNMKENLCEKSIVLTFNDWWLNGDPTYGGFANKWRGEKSFVVKIPDQLSSVNASSIFCAGVTTYVPLRRHGVGPGSKVAIIGLGGLGHFGVQWAKAMGATVIAYGTSDKKFVDAKLLGCDDYILVQDHKSAEAHLNTFTHILATKIDNENWDMYFKMLKTNGVFIMCDVPEAPLSGINAAQMTMKQITIASSFIGSPKDLEETLDFAAKIGVRTWANEFPMSKINEAIQFVRQRKPRYRAVLMN